MTSTPRSWVRITTTDGRVLYWHKNGEKHSLSPEIAETWVGRFQYHLFQVTPAGAFVPRGSDPAAVDVEQVELEAITD